VESWVIVDVRVGFWSSAGDVGERGAGESMFGGVDSQRLIVL